MINRILLTGRLTKDPEIRRVANGKNVAHCRVAVERRYKNAEGERQADFLDFSIWGKPAETLVSYAGKGSLLAIEGEMRSRNYDDQNGKRHFLTEIICTSFSFLESKAMRGRSNEQFKADIELEQEDLPF
ncbi:MULTISPECIES: single-stranded DNA-binding protein [unclassified Enterococcus]|uniref:single-stranded DNA-binding protein n=1 Tax=unclassified Enterococcus TaxID=2608891 RepID=UPI001552581C|nr:MULTISPECIES: single-stranded DNA-binding protein [unclassified Enterococcus]MBS7577410.1 single-stranded DNA-binding protein [Enterococcus sp. MMGLQ5-2]MBS7584817.1 single-stranded DNA-binding protein [Enterococcus sp. MMGLQ5-1]NPD12672.1 single-stranded DNA-binding protein [Enterococcus sp. MMGLQ5-1]NPD37244.1 single-stranded DNA-binding protein [Enterococcus sp. MMGLQ5-2]